MHMSWCSDDALGLARRRNRLRLVCAVEASKVAHVLSCPLHVSDLIMCCFASPYQHCALVGLAVCCRLLNLLQVKLASRCRLFSVIRCESLVCFCWSKLNHSSFAVQDCMKLQSLLLGKISVQIVSGKATLTGCEHKAG